MHLDDLWIGDLLKIKSTEKIGKFSGSDDGKAIIKNDDETWLVDLIDLEKVAEQDILLDKKKPIIKDIHLQHTSFDLMAAASFHTTLDLHIEKLSPSLQKGPTENIVRYQLKACDTFLSKAGSYQIKKVKIIHGIGRGKLRIAVEEILNRHHFVDYFETSTHGAAFDVYLK